MTPKKTKAWAYYHNGEIQPCMHQLTTLCIHSKRPKLDSGKIVKEFVQVEIRPIRSKRREKK